ncbi:malonyl-CoA decarboxylase domain-containing protein [Hyphococcus lacteus]|uniref:Malonyl-CoA decarboxylase family protein n=1 Tax=Hyphococcus lacteus TaxID=3143536 RepID=A0ABV3Z7I4_9PROT
MEKLKFTVLKDWIDALLRRDHLSPSLRGKATSAAIEAMTRPAKERLRVGCDILMTRIGDASRVAVAEQALNAYSELTDHDKIEFFRMLRDEYGINSDAVRTAYREWEDLGGPDSVASLFRVTEPRRQILLRRLNTTSNATLRLVRMREDLLSAVRKEPSLAAIDEDFSHLFGSWFNRGFLKMRRIDWNSSAAILEKIMRYESVHSMDGWEDIRRRLDPRDRRLYAFFHPATGDEPLIFVEVALTKGVPSTIAEILNTPAALDPEEADTAVFYSINNCLPGLKGVSFGNFLIKQVVAELSSESENLKQFVTLSPMPGFVKWLGKQKDEKIIALAERLENGVWLDDPSLTEAMRSEVIALAARYIVTERNSAGVPLDPVARFHLGNGACAWRINWPADLSSIALEKAGGLMINYLYDPAALEMQHEIYIRDGTVAHSKMLAECLVLKEEIFA